ncbi:bifunctional 2-keto-4-hydroxyglutarate aldolase/2-keto-3-deoxy-6-phosphogluconate aldolase [Sporolactobacillus putidus]|uniref:Bifunctional 2-keto-4-hydroxyglutarate aldolase/2-keto-3-deoxy-6-phosphogluconate aldolase n=1 Tax=Sporolactobacillus putidus TaxID=492735 RepID=A0A917S0N4_9BACL|nr:bifunctional 2-keto-4-hydroxyglutarate aldolase/2-keto-3-deoxy-6-phosphogluconate aldolase [Sporolactobacillus putidus]GGL46875.1 bifunctional 2-keto-4-hydroxyglutarate aldolase/2-keto-3-deoxy-6-phosphogluconate aldolase [Sporolactobacillus putidus]
MLKKYEVLQEIKSSKIVAVIRGRSAEEACEISRACIRGGIKAIEVTFTTPNSLRVLQKLSNEDVHALIGAGTVLDAETARLAIMNGAAFVVSPNFSKEICETCNLYSVPYLPGCFTITEMVSALRAGADVIKVFPGSVAGPDYIKSVKGPLPNINLMPTGGVGLDNVVRWLDEGSFAVGVGSVLTKAMNGEDYKVVEENARKFVEKVSVLSGSAV